MHGMKTNVIMKPRGSSIFDIIFTWVLKGKQEIREFLKILSPTTPYSKENGLPISLSPRLFTLFRRFRFPWWIGEREIMWHISIFQFFYETFGGQINNLAAFMWPNGIFHHQIKGKKVFFDQVHVLLATCLNLIHLMQASSNYTTDSSL